MYIYMYIHTIIVQWFPHTDDNIHVVDIRRMKMATTCISLLGMGKQALRSLRMTTVSLEARRSATTKCNLTLQGRGCKRHELLIKCMIPTP